MFFVQMVHMYDREAHVMFVLIGMCIYLVNGVCW
jgi:hypothetical protein